ncbi:CBS domain-containing protein [Alcaligenaceae bacterium]|nr:CBS domain-containing protein [Alcaligenaceae bacterium]
MTLITAMLPVARRRLVTLDVTAPVIQAAKLLSAPNTNLVIACDPDGLMVGVLTKADIVQQISRCTGCSCVTAVADIMTRDIIKCCPEDRLQDIWGVMKSKALRQIPVSDQQSRPLGLLDASDALQVLLKEVEYEEDLLRDYVMGIGYR